MEETSQAHKEKMEQLAYVRETEKQKHYYRMAEIQLKHELTKRFS